MKKVTAIFLLLTFLVANTGMAVTIHYCGGKLSSIDIFSFDKHPCKCGKKAMKKDCCKDKTTFLKMKEDLAKTNSIVFKTPSVKQIFPLVRQFELVPSAQFQYLVSAFYHPPPFKPKAPIYLLDRVFLI